MKGLIVDDEYFARKGMRVTIPWEKFGIQICGEADCMEQALEFLEDTEVEIVFTDLTMPNGSGFELIKKIREKFPQIYIVVVTCHRDFNMIQKAFRMGAIDYIVKTELEEGVFEESLERISKYVEKQKEKEQGKGLGEIYGEVSAKEIKAAFVEEWSDFRWIYDKSYFEDLFHRTKKASLTKEIQNQIYYDVVSEWEFCIGLGNASKRYEKRFLEASLWKDYIEIMEEMQHSMKQRFSLQKYPKDTVVLVLNTIGYVKRNVYRDVNQEEITQVFNISRSYFSRVFKGIFGVNYADYCRNYKMWIAKKLLTETNLPMYQIAERVGFTDERYFSRIFRESIGEKPSRYRKQQKESEA